MQSFTVSQIVIMCKVRGYLHKYLIGYETVACRINMWDSYNIHRTYLHFLEHKLHMACVPIINEAAHLTKRYLMHRVMYFNI